MSDREMLEFAAKAAGLDAQWDCPERGMMMLTPNGVDTMTWNPLTNDGDALRLAVKLAIDFKIRNGVTWWDHQKSDGVVSWGHEPHNNDPLAATRRAIVRAAAEIGRQMP